MPVSRESLASGRSNGFDHGCELPMLHRLGTSGKPLIEHSPSNPGIPTGLTVPKNSPFHVRAGVLVEWTEYRQSVPGKPSCGVPLGLIVIAIKR